jgi:TonB family protein
MSLSAHPSHRLDQGYYRRVEVALALALGIHAAVMLLAPPYVPRPYRLDASPLRLVAAGAAGSLGDGSREASRRVAPPSEADASPPRAAAFARVHPAIVTEQITSTGAPDSPGSDAARKEGSGSRGPGTGAGGDGSAYGADDGSPPVFYAFDSPPVALERAEPEYPLAAKVQGAAGLVVLNANVDERGRVIRVWVARSTAPEILVTSAIDAMYRFRFTPGSQQGIPVKCTVAVPFNFHLNIHL